MLALAAAALIACEDAPAPASNLPPRPTVAAAPVAAPLASATDAGSADAGHVPDALDAHAFAEAALPSLWAQAQVGDAETFALGDLLTPGHRVPVQVRVEVVQRQPESAVLALTFAAPDGTELPAALQKIWLAHMTIQPGPPPSKPPPDFASAPVHHMRDVPFHVLTVDEVRGIPGTDDNTGRPLQHATWVYPPEDAYLVADILNTAHGDAMLVDVARGHGGAGAVPAGGLWLDGTATVEHVRTDAVIIQIIGRPPSKPDVTRATDSEVVSGSNGMFGAGGKGTLLRVAREMLEATNLRLQPPASTTARLRGHKLAIFGPDGDHAGVWAADPLDPALAGAPFTVRFRPIQSTTNGRRFMYEDRVLDWKPVR
jgi:hypothetical protein